ncbi:MAG: hypothetical protein WAJ85_06630 [Candidatus Baltobacteraceae bacterium]
MINIHRLGATVRLEDGSLASVTAAELAAHRATFTAGLEQRAVLPFAVTSRGRHPTVALAPNHDPVAAAAAPFSIDRVFEERLTAYLKETEAWAPADRPPPAERHFIRKKRRAALFEARSKPT